MYITLKSIKRNLGFKGMEIADFVIGIPIVILFIIIFAFTKYKIMAILELIIGIFCMLPINFSKKNRMYKALMLIFKYLFKNKKYIYREEKRLV